jgi:uncharacterized protein YjbI with pentapeptide repeats
LSGEENAKLPVEIFDATGEVVYRAYVKDPTQGLRGASLESFVAPLAQLQGLDLSNSTLYWACLSDADLSFAKLAGAEMRGAILDGAICRHTDFRGADLSRDNLGGRTSLKGADLSNAFLERALLTDAVFDGTTKFPEDFDPKAAGMVHMRDLPADDPLRDED